MSAATPGPWSVFHETHVMGNERLVAACGGYANSARPAYDENAANARLIAEAPAMLALLETIVELNFHVGDAMREDICATVAKARGAS